MPKLDDMPLARSTLPHLLLWLTSASDTPWFMACVFDPCRQRTAHSVSLKINVGGLAAKKPLSFLIESTTSKMSNSYRLALVDSSCLILQNKQGDSRRSSYPPHRPTHEAITAASGSLWLIFPTSLLNLPIKVTMKCG